MDPIETKDLVNHLTCSFKMARDRRTQDIKTVLAMLEDSLPYLQDHEISFLQRELVCITATTFNLKPESIQTCVSHSRPL